MSGAPRSPLPIDATLPRLRRALAEQPCVILSAPPGSGKTTGVPLALLDEPWLSGQKIVMLEPRRLAARTSARRMADLLGESVGERVGYQIRFDRKVSAATRIEVVTEGILTRRLQSDPELSGVGLLIFDEFHERSIHADLALALALDVQQALREGLRLLLMSATLEIESLTRVLGDVPVVIGEGRSFPVEIRMAEVEPRGSIVDVAVAGVRRALAETRGDLLCFLPGTGEIRAAHARLQGEVERGVILCPLHGELSRSDQELALRPDSGGRRRVILATSIAETSLTIEGVHTVVDSGWSRRPRFDPNNGLSRLETVRVSRAAAAQRAGRAGRLGAGYCYRLWSAATDARLVAHHPPEIVDSDQGPLALELASWGDSDPAALRWIDPPPPGSYAQALELLQTLGALDPQRRITREGERMARLGCHPRLAHMLLCAAERGQGGEAADLAALLSDRSPLRRGEGAQPVDLELHLEPLRQFRRRGDAGARASGGDPAVCRRLEQAAKRWRSLLKEGRGGQRLALGTLLASAYPDRIGQRRDGAEPGFRLSSGRGATIPRSDPLAAAEWIVAASLDAGRREGRIYLAAPLSLDALREPLARHIERGDRTEWDVRGEKVVAVTEERLGRLVLSSTAQTTPDPEAVARALMEGIHRMGLDSLPWSEATRQWRDRVLCLRQWLPEEGWPDLSDTTLLHTLDQWLLPGLYGLSRRSHLQRLDLAALLRNTLAWDQQQRLEQLAPTHLQVPSGSRVRLHYQPGAPPVLAVRLQELFGLADTPTLCNHRIPVMLHLLSPARRPIQITQDLSGFWERTYPEVKKELKGRYPKHAWPDDPWSAQATARVRRVR